MTTSTAAAPPRRSIKARHRRSRATGSQVAAVTAVCVVAGLVAAATASASPTGSMVVDLAYRAGLVVLTTVAASRARRWSLATGAGLVTVGAGGWWGVAGLAAIALTFALAWEDRRHRVTGALVGALVGLTALHLGWPATTFMTAALAAAATVPIWISAYRTSSRIVRRRTRFAIASMAVLCGLGVVGMAIFGLSQRSNVQTAIEDALRAADRVGSSSPQSSTEAFAAAHERLDRVVATADAPWMLPARVVPVIGANLSSIRESAAAGSTLAAAAGRLGAKVDYRRLHRDGGGVDLAVLRSFEEPLAEIDDALAASQTALSDAHSPFLIAPVAHRMASLERRVVNAHRDATTARMGVRVAPGLLGGSGLRRYLLLLGNPAEARDLGGHIGNWAEVTAEDGRLRVVRVGEPYGMYLPFSADRPFLPDADTFPRSLTEMNPTLYPQNWGASPDLPTVARLAAELYPQVPGGGPVDGVIYADTRAFAAALGITGPVTIPGTNRTLDSSTAAEFLERGQYDEFQRSAVGDRAVTDMVRNALGRLLEGRVPSPEAVATHLGPVAETGHLRFFPLHTDEIPFARRLGVDGAVAAPRGGDLLAVINRNANPSKIDVYLHRSITDRVTFDPSTGAVHAQVEIRLTNSAPQSGLPRDVGNPPPGAAPGTNRNEVAVLSPFRSTGSTLDGQAVALGTRSDVNGLERHSVLVDLAPGQTRTLVVDLDGKVAGRDYRLRWIPQPLANDDSAQLSIRSTGAPFRGDVAGGTVELGDRDRTLTVSTER